MFAAQENKEHVVFLQEVSCWTVRGGLFREVAHTCELESLNTKKSIDCGDAKQIISLYGADRKHFPCK